MLKYKSKQVYVSSFLLTKITLFPIRLPYILYLCKTGRVSTTLNHILHQFFKQNKGKFLNKIYTKHVPDEVVDSYSGMCK